MVCPPLISMLTLVPISLDSYDMRYDPDLGLRYQLCHVPTSLLATRSVWYVVPLFES